MAIRNPFRAAFDGMVEARQRQANRRVADILMQLDEESLRRIGQNRASLRAKRNGSESIF